MSDDDETLEWARAAAVAADDKLGRNVVILEVGPLMAVCEYFVIASGTNARQVRTLAEEVEERVDAVGGPKPLRIEGLRDCQWVLLDYGSFVVHVFDEATRAFYDLERLWADVPRLPWAGDDDPTGPNGADGPTDSDRPG